MKPGYIHLMCVVRRWMKLTTQSIFAAVKPLRYRSISSNSSNVSCISFLRSCFITELELHNPNQMSLIDTDKCRAMESGIFHTIVIFAINEQIKSHSTETNRTFDIRS